MTALIWIPLGALAAVVAVAAVIMLSPHPYTRHHRRHHRFAAALNPGIRFAGIEVSIKGDGVMKVNLQLDQEITLFVKPTDRAGKPAQLDEQDVAPEFVLNGQGQLIPDDKASDDLSRIYLPPDVLDPNQSNVAVVTCSADADMAPGVQRTLQDQWEITLAAPEAQALNASTSEPRTKRTLPAA